MIAKVLLSLVVLLAAVVGSAWLVGRRMPTAHSVNVVREIDAPIAKVADLIRNVEAQPTWRGGVQRIAVTTRSDTDIRYVESGSNGDIPFRFREVTQGVAFVSTIDTDALPFSGEWYISLDAITAERTRVTIREDGRVGPPLFRVISTYVIGHTTNIDGYLRDLANAAVTR